MVDRKLTELPAAVPPLDGKELVYIVKNNLSEKTTTEELRVFVTKDLAVGVTYPMKVPDGDINKPSIGHLSDADTGIYFPQTGRVHLATNGVDALRLDDGDVIPKAFFIPTVTTAPTGAPHVHTGYSNIVLNIADRKLYFYANGAWNTSGGAGGDGDTTYQVQWSAIAGLIAPGVTVEGAIANNFAALCGKPPQRNDIIVVSGAAGAAASNNGSYTIIEDPGIVGRWIVIKIAKDPSQFTFLATRATTPPATNTLGVGHMVFTTENGHKSLSVVDSAGNLVNLFNDDDIAARIAANSLFQGAVSSDGDLSGLPNPATANRGFYWTWQGASNHVIAAPGVTGSVADPTNGLLGRALNTGDWLQSDGTKWIHVSADLLSKARWMNLGAFGVWSAGTYERGALVIYRQTATDPLRYYRATANVTATDGAPGAAGAPWEDISPEVKLSQVKGVDVLTNPPTEGQVLSYHTDHFEPVTVMQPLTFVGNGAYNVVNILSRPDNFGMAADTAPDPKVVYPVPGDTYIDLQTGRQTIFTGAGGSTVPPISGGRIASNIIGAISTAGQALGELAKLTDVDVLTNPPAGGQALVWDNNAALWVPGDITSPIIYLGNGAWDATAIDSKLLNYGMGPETVPDPQVYAPRPGDQYIDLDTGVITAFTGDPPSIFLESSRDDSMITGGTATANRDIIVERLGGLTDVDLTTPATNGQALIYDATNNVWTAADRTLAALSDTNFPTPPKDGDHLVWVDANKKWEAITDNGIDEYDPTVTYRKGDIVLENGGIWRAREAGILPAPERKTNNAYLSIKLTGYDPEELFQITSVSNAAPDATTDVSTSVSHKFHLEYHDDSNWKVYAYDKTAKTWKELTGATHLTWRSLGEPPDPDRPSQITLWIKSTKTSRSAPTVAAPQWEHFRIATSLAALDDVRLVDETPGQSLVLDKTGRWVAGSAPAHIPEWTASTTNYVVGDVTHFEGRFWRANRQGQDLVKPEMQFGAAAIIYNVDGTQYVRTIRLVSATVLTTPPASIVDNYLRYVSDTDWSFYKAGYNSSRALEWQEVTSTTKTIWRHVALPAPGVRPFQTLWIYSLPGSSSAPITGQTDWTPILLGDFLVSLADVAASNAQPGDTLVSDGKGKWIAQQAAVQGYTKPEIDQKLSALITGIEHEESVLSITNTPPASPKDEDVVIVGTAPTGAFVGHVNALARWDATLKDASNNPAPAWVFETPRANEAHLVEDQDAIWHFNGTSWSKIASAAAGSSGSGLAGIGEIVAWPLDTIPDDYIECKGQVVAVSSYPDLYAVIGNKYNAGTAADGSTTFALPDLRGYFLRGAGSNLNGTQGGAVGSFHNDSTKRPNTPFTVDSQGSHTHTLDANGQHHHTTTLQMYGAAGGGMRVMYNGYNEPKDYQSSDDGNHTHNVQNSGAHTHTITSGGDAESAPYHFVVKWLIRWKAIGQGARGPKGEPGTNGLNGGVQVYSGTGAFPAAAARKAGDAYFAQDSKQLYIVETDGANPATDLKVLDQHVIRGDITLGANAATAQEIILVRGIDAGNESVYVDFTDAYTSGERSGYSFHIFGISSTGTPPMAPIHFHIATSHFAYFRLYWMGGADKYVLAAKVDAGNNGVTYHAALRFPNALDSGVSFDGNTVSTNTGGTTLNARNNYSMQLLPRVAARKSLSHHMYADNTWEDTLDHIGDLKGYVPVGNMFKIEISARGLAYHGGDLELRSYIEVAGANGSTGSKNRQLNDSDNSSTKAVMHSFVDTISATSAAAVVKISSFAHGGSNGDRQVFGEILIWDLGPASLIPTFS